MDQVKGRVSKIKMNQFESLMVNILARYAYLYPIPEICRVLFLPHFSRCFAIMRVRKVTRWSSLRLRIVKLLKLRLLNMKLTKKSYNFTFFLEINAWKLPKIGPFSECLDTGRAYFCPIFQFWEKTAYYRFIFMKLIQQIDGQIRVQSIGATSYVGAVGPKRGKRGGFSFKTELFMYAHISQPAAPCSSLHA